MAHKTVICYAREDKEFREELDRHLSNLRHQQLIVSWSDREIAPGTEWRKEVDTQLNTADLILLLISADFLSSECCYSIEMQQALQRHNAGLARVIPILLRSVIAVPLIIGLQWILRCPMLLMAFVNKLFEAWLQRKLAMLRENADRYATRQADKVIALSRRTLMRYHSQIFNALHQALLEFFDGEAFKILHLYDRQGTVDVVVQNFDKKKSESVYNATVTQIHAIMSPYAKTSWERSIFLLKKASKALKIEPRWNILKEKTLVCARQVVWEMLEPEINDLVKALVKERFTRVVLITIVQSERKKETTVSLTEIKDLFKMKSSLHISLNELPIFCSSPIGMTLTWTFNRLWREARLPQNKGLRPVIVLISDGQPTDSKLVDLPLLADKIKQLGIPIICCFITNRNVARPWVLRNHPGIFWSGAARLMFAISSSVDEYPQLAEQLKESRFVVQKQAKLFIQPNHSDYVRNFVKALLLPHRKEYRVIEPEHGGSDCPGARGLIL